MVGQNYILAFSQIVGGKEEGSIVDNKLIIVQVIIKVAKVVQLYIFILGKDGGFRIDH